MPVKMLKCCLSPHCFICESTKMELWELGILSAGCLGPQGPIKSSTLCDVKLITAKIFGIFPHRSFNKADFRFAPNQWEMALLCKDVSHWLGTSLESGLRVKGHNYVMWHIAQRHKGGAKTLRKFWSLSFFLILQISSLTKFFINIS